MGTKILIYSGSNPNKNRCIEISGSVHKELARVLRKFTCKPTVDTLADALGGKPADMRFAEVTIKVSGWSCYLSNTRKTWVYKTAWDPKPGVNYIPDPRVRPAPFLRDGSCRG